MPVQNHINENISETLPSNENCAEKSTHIHFNPQNKYYFRFAHDPQTFLFISDQIINQGSLSQGNLIFAKHYNSTHDNRFRFRIVSTSDIAPTVSIMTTNVNANSASALASSSHKRLFATAISASAKFIIKEVRKGIYNIMQNPNEGFIGLPGAIADDNSQVFVKPNFTPLEREWFITTDPFSPMQAIMPIEEGVYTIHTTRQPSSGIDTPLTMDEESEPFINTSELSVTQFWRFNYDFQLNAYQILNRSTRPLLAYDSGIASTPSRQRYRLRFADRLNQTEATYWYVNPTGDGSFTLSSVRFPDQKIDLTMGITTNFNPVQLSQFNDYDSQNWLLTRIL